MKRIEGSSALAQKCRSGKIKYCLWIDRKGALYVEMTENILKTKKKGSCSDFLFRVSEYWKDDSPVNTRQKPLFGYDPKDKYKKKAVLDNNNSTFLEAVLKHLFSQNDK